MGNNRISVEPIAGALGAEIGGVDLAEPLEEAVIGEIRRALLDHLVIFFRDQHLTPEQHLVFGRRFGSLQVHDFVGGTEGYPEIIEVRKEPEETRNFGGGWHTDVSYLERPALGSVLYAREVPEFGGDTMFANQYLAYETLSEGMRAMLDGMIAVHSARRPYGINSARARSGPASMRIRLGEDAEAEIEHPVVRTHPETGRKALYVNGNFTIRFKDMTEEESAPLLDFLERHAVRPEFTCRFRWQPNAIAFWDNRCVQHNAINDYQGQRRVMHRVTIEGERPV
ncbi:MAG: TauD/TfdA family dioxygenase [Alphaproteobacteria bacterium]|nr:TauD/TfdA family dioxygenase [Alphaproteobacteria bacterium]MBV9862764.1 TauD/TfdA family dioxygenase [Alphaproteobacteria bacterium]